MKRKLYTLFLIQLAILPILWEEMDCQAQNNPDIKRTMHWYFGQKAGIDFSTGTAVADTNGQLDLGSSLGCATISDTVGNLLFYTDGQSVYNKNHQIMNNGNDLYSYGSCHQSSIIIPKPMSTNIYYIFTTDGFEHGGSLGLRYTIVDINANNGLGDVIEKNILLFNPNSEILASIKHKNCQDIWVVAHERYNNCFRSYLVTKFGVDTNPVISCIGHAGQYSPYGYMLKFSPDGSKAVSTAPAPYDSVFELTGMYYIDLLNFNNTSGLFTNLITIQTDTFIGGLSFSPDNNKLYIFSSNVWVNPSRVYQFDVSIWDSSVISLTKIIIIPPNSIYGFGDFQIAPNNEIFVGKDTDSSYIAIIHNPNATGLSCDFDIDGLYLNGKTCGYSLPNFIESYFDTIICYNNINNELLENNDKISIYPNPFDDCTTIELYTEFEINNAELELYDMLGNEVFQSKINAQKFILKRNNLSSGIYLLKIKLDNNQIYNNKLIIN